MGWDLGPSGHSLLGRLPALSIPSLPALPKEGPVARDCKRGESEPSDPANAPANAGATVGTQPNQGPRKCRAPPGWFSGWEVKQENPNGTQANQGSRKCRAP